MSALVAANALLTRENLADDIARRLDRQIWILTTLVGVDVVEMIPAARVSMAARNLASQLLGADPRIAAQAAIDCAQLLGGWESEQTTPLGRAVTLTTEQTVSQSDAARLLGVSRQRVGQLVDEGKLEPVNLAVSVASIRRRLIG